ncbi:MAG: diguanylate cyclase [Rhodococcus sp. (in: high G+C Gram-positive bacteria)]
MTTTTDAPVSTSRLIVGVAALAGVVFVAAIVGIQSRPPGLLASLWLANSVVLATFARRPSMFTVSAVGATFASLVAADLLSGTDTYAAITFNLANVVGIVGGTLVIRFRHPEPLTMSGSQNFARMCVAIVVASLLSTAIAALSALRSDPNGPTVVAAAWLTSEVTSYLILVSVILSFRVANPRHRTTPITAKTVLTTESLPFVLTIVLMLVGLTVQGPLLLALPLPALLWCATRVHVFGTSLLTALWAGWTLVLLGRGVLRTGGVLMSEGPSATLSVALIALGPLLVATISLDRTRVQAKLRAALEYDNLTGVLSRGAFLRRSQQRLDELISDSRPVALLMLDLDHFKAINDTMGHAVGDIALVRSAACILGALPNNAIAGRIGGEEFAVLLPQADKDYAASIAHSIRRDHERLHVLSARTATVSIGLVWTDAAPRSVSPLLVSADHALYDAKRSGRNTVVAVDLA